MGNVLKERPGPLEPHEPDPVDEPEHVPPPSDVPKRHPEPSDPV